jgi:hypothetical protein
MKEEKSGREDGVGGGRSGGRGNGDFTINGN